MALFGLENKQLRPEAYNRFVFRNKKPSIIKLPRQCSHIRCHFSEERFKILILSMKATIMTLHLFSCLILGSHNGSILIFNHNLTFISCLDVSLDPITSVWMRQNFSGDFEGLCSDSKARIFSIGSSCIDEDWRSESTVVQDSSIFNEISSIDCHPKR